MTTYQESQPQPQPDDYILELTVDEALQLVQQYLSKGMQGVPLVAGDLIQLQGTNPEQERVDEINRVLKGIRYDLPYLIYAYSFFMEIYKEAGKYRNREYLYQGLETLLQVIEQMEAHKTGDLK